MEFFLSGLRQVLLTAPLVDILKYDKLTMEAWHGPTAQGVDNKKNR
jgi:hypothetical protein